MNSVILQLASPYVRSLLIFFSLIALWRGHNSPGGGFIGGLLAALAIVFYSFAFDRRQIQKKLKIKPEGYVTIGLALILTSILPSLFTSQALMKGIWINIPMGLLGELKLGSPLLFDVGVFMAVIGVTLMLFFILTNRK
ncbi:multisubunit sodium/proton antiporter, MrpB subunit [Saccharicrinis carchari]|uniref:Multisubunit sodium/proton antiporter, MrpB subunit n=1 Tax=Saccharicrinis carchari TaxID=1168039 RepID=A0A521AZY1_SACCC|nr:MnhB domain-containing protein [Saccharicrinis carchari]SMO40090.1 multisubunit sodium/proton antiporter, MrpB subunit [Saccharicrinis carchari]